MDTIEKKCDKCDGKIKHVCSLCKGTGRRIEIIKLTPNWNMENQSMCPLCHGTGNIVDSCDILKNS